jgi:hypothetical protein
MFHLAAGMRQNHSGAKGPENEGSAMRQAAGVHPDSQASYQVDSHEADR